MKLEPLPDQMTSARTDVAIQHELHRDYETRSTVSLKKVGAAVYAADPSTEILWVAYAIDDQPVQLWRPGDPIPPAWFEAAANPNWIAVAHNDHFESCIDLNILHPHYGFPLIPPERHRCTQAASLALGLPAKLGLLADVLEFTHRKDAAGERLMHQLAKPRKPRKGEDPAGTYWHDDESKMLRLGAYCMQDVEVEREADSRVAHLTDAEQAVWQLSNTINLRGFHVDRPFAEAARKIAQAAAPEINDEIAEITNGAVTSLAQIAKMAEWLKAQGCETEKLDRKAIEQLFDDDALAAPARRVLELRLNGAQAAVKKIDALLARAGTDDRIRGAFRYHGASTGRWAGEGYQPQNLKRPEVKDLDAAIAAVATGDYALMKQLYPKPLSVVGDCSRAMIAAEDENELIGADLSSIEGRVAALVAGEEWKLEIYRRFDQTGDPRLEPYCITACKIFGVPDGSYDKNSPERKVGKTCELAFGYAGGLGAWRKFEPDRFTDEEVETFKQEWRAAHPKIVRYWYNIDTAAVRAVHHPGEEFVCGPVILKSDGAFLRIKLPSGRDLCYPNPRLIVDDRDHAKVVYDDNSGGRFAPCRGGFGAYSGIWFENIVSGISRDILVEAMFRIEAAGYPIVLHVHDEAVAEVPIGSGDEQEFIGLMTQPPSWAPDLPIAANAWRGHRYDKSEKPAASGTATAGRATPKPVQPAAAVAGDKGVIAPNDTKSREFHTAPTSSATTSTSDDSASDDNGHAGVAVSFTRFEAHGKRLSKHYERTLDGNVVKFGGTEMGRGKYETITIEAADPPAVLAEIGARIDAMGFREAIGLGVVKDGLPSTGDITTKAAYERRQGNKRATATGIPRALSHFNWPGAPAPGLLLFDGDEKDGVAEILTALYPPFAEVAALVRPSASASVKDPATGERLKAGEHLFVLLDEPAKSKACLVAIQRLSWCVGSGRSAGWLGMAKDGDPLVYGPCDVTVGSPERLVYEGEVSLGKGLERLPRNSTVIGGRGVLCAADLIAFADKHAPVKQFDELVAAAKIDPAFLAQQATVKAAYRVDHIEKGVAQGKPREEVEKEFDRVTRADGSKIGERIWRELSPHHVLFFPDGRPFLASEMGEDPKRFHGKDCADPIEGLSYQSRNPGWILHQGGRVEIYSRAHSDRYAYILKLFDEEDFGGMLKGSIDASNDPNNFGGNRNTASAGLGASSSASNAPTASSSSGPSGGGPSSGPANVGNQPGFVNKNKPVIKYGPLSYMADAAASVLIDAEVPFYQRGKSLVRPVVKQVQTFNGKMTSAAQLVEIELPFLRDTLCQNSCWVKYNAKKKKWMDIHPPVDPAQVLLKRFGNWGFPVLAGIITTPTLRPDGTILRDAGYDPLTQLLLIDPPAMPVIPDSPT
jgi:DNA polymerase